jgi:hypothetical protein
MLFHTSFSHLITGLCAILKAVFNEDAVPNKPPCRPCKPYCNSNTTNIVVGLFRRLIRGAGGNCYKCYCSYLGGLQRILSSKVRANNKP